MWKKFFQKLCIQDKWSVRSYAFLIMFCIAIDDDISDKWRRAAMFGMAIATVDLLALFFLGDTDESGV